jgi:hypothetical protein
MSHWHGKAIVGLVLLVSASSPSEAQLDLSTVLVGKWEGEVQMASGTYPRTLIIRSIQGAAQGQVAKAEYSGQGNDYGGPTSMRTPVDVAIEAFGNDVILRFRTPESYPVELSLYKDRRHLLGSLRISTSRIAWGINPVRLTKAE